MTGNDRWRSVIPTNSCSLNFIDIHNLSFHLGSKIFNGWRSLKLEYFFFFYEVKKKKNSKGSTFKICNSKGSEDFTTKLK